MEPVPSVEFQFITSAAPVQAEGTVGGRHFFFHARHDEWSFSVAEWRGDDPAALTEAEDGHRGWFRSGRLGERGAASYLPHAEATALIRDCAAAYLHERGLTNR